MSVYPFSGLFAIIYQKKIKPITLSAKPKPLVGPKIPFDPDGERLVEDGKVGGLLVKAKALFGSKKGNTPRIIGNRNGGESNVSNDHARGGPGP